jgi:hypothetical protein
VSCCAHPTVRLHPFPRAVPAARPVSVAIWSTAGLPQRCGRPAAWNVARSRSQWTSTRRSPAAIRGAPLRTGGPLAVRRCRLRGTSHRNLECAAWVDTPVRRRTSRSRRYASADPGSAIERCLSALTLSGNTLAAAPWAFVAIPPAMIVFLPFISASKPCFAITSGSSSGWFRPWCPSSRPRHGRGDGDAGVPQLVLQGLGAGLQEGRGRVVV